MVAQSRQCYPIKAFILFCIAWVLDMLLLSQLGPMGKSPLLFATGYVLGFVLMALMVYAFPCEWSRRRSIAVVVGVGVLGRFAFWDFPVSNDLYRYIWEGYIQNHGFNPYLLAPNDPALEALIQGDMAAIWSQINHKDLSAAYPPLVMLIFRALAALSPTASMFKGSMLFFETLTVGALIGLICWRRTHPAHLFWYAANPLVLVYIAGEAHLDIVQAAFVMIGLYFAGSKRPVAAFLMLGSAVASKYFSLVALPFIMRRSNCHAWPALAIAVVWFLPFVDEFRSLFASLSIFAGQMHYNDALADLLRILCGRFALTALVPILMGLLTVIYLFEQREMRSVYLAFGAVLLCLPTLHPWYILLVAPFMVFYPSRAWLFLMLAAVTTLPVLAIEHDTGVFQEMRWLKWFEYLPFFGLLVFDTLTRYSMLPRPRFPAPKTISVVIPALNEAERITDAIRSARIQKDVVEIIVADGGSSDATRDVARRCGAKVISSPIGRGRQVRKVIKHTGGDVILVLHADSHLLAEASGSMLQALAKHPSVAGGAFKMRFNGHSPKLKLIAWLNNFRALFFGISFGDQGQFVRRQALEKIGGFPDMMLMEDVELSMRLKSISRPLFVHKGVLVSQRRWQHKHYGQNVWLVIRLFLRYLLERRFLDVVGLRTNYYQKYYQKPERSRSGVAKDLQ